LSGLDIDILADLIAFLAAVRDLLSKN